MLRGNNPALGLFVLRIGIGLIFLMHGLGKLIGPPFAGFGMDGTIGFFAGLGLPAAAAWLAMVLETGGGIALILGAGARIAALLLAVEMAVAFIKVDFARGFMGGYEFNVALVAGLACVMLGGPGILSVQVRPRS